MNSPSDPQASDPADALLLEASDGDNQRLQHMRQRVAAGEPAAYVAGYCRFMGRRFRMDRRAYITDPELEYLLHAVIQRGDELLASLGRPPHLLEFGVGAGTLAITLKLERPHWLISGIDIDADALALATENVDMHAVELELFQSDFLESWPEQRTPPDLIFGDPPWGSNSDLYDANRDAAYYEHMPRHSVYPESSSRTGVHDALLQHILQRSWQSEIMLNYGILQISEIRRSAKLLPHYNIIHPCSDLRILHGFCSFTSSH